MTTRMTASMTIRPFHIQKEIYFENSFSFLNALDQYKLKLENMFSLYIAPSLRTGPPHIYKGFTKGKIQKILYGP